LNEPFILRVEPAVAKSLRVGINLKSTGDRSISFDRCYYAKTIGH